ncbi:uncharacterized protein [Amphiura filiformis]|uniref:uncharacterized protein n=1 Tax=Amphiura filiformis TaxID=82378 RepID=UPI003B2226EE
MAEGGHSEFCQVKITNNKKASGFSVTITQHICIFAERNVVASLKTYAEQRLVKREVKLKDNGGSLEIIGKGQDGVLTENQENELFKYICKEFGFKLITSHGFAIGAAGDCPCTTWMFAK